MLAVVLTPNYPTPERFTIVCQADTLQRGQRHYALRRGTIRQPRCSFHCNPHLYFMRRWVKKLARILLVTAFSFCTAVR